MMKQFNLEEIKRTIAENYDWGPSEDWTNFHFKKLHQEITRLTGDRLSEETLKRIFGKRKVDTENYQPQAFSQIILVKFIENLENLRNKDKQKKSDKKVLSKILISVSVFLILGFIFILISHLLEKPKSYQFKCVNPNDTYPYTAIFKYDISEIKDSVFTNFGINKKTYLPPERSMINCFYKYPGAYNVLFYTKSQMLDTLKIMARSTEWQGGYFPNREPELFQPFFDQSSYRQDDYFYALPETLYENGIDLKMKFWTTYRYFSNFNNSLDNLTLETRVQNNESTGSYLCYDINISLIGESGIIDFVFTHSMKCLRYAQLTISEIKLDGAYDDLSALSVDLSDWLDVRLKTENNNFQLFNSDKLIFEKQYKQPLGNLIGVVYTFYGSGKIDDLKIKDSNDEIFFENDFSSNKRK